MKYSELEAFVLKLDEEAVNRVCGESNDYPDHYDSERFKRLLLAELLMLIKAHSSTG